MTLQPGSYIATISLGQGEQPGYWGMEVVAPVGVLAGGFNLGGTIQRRSLPPGFGAIYVPFPQTVHFHVDAQAADGSPNSTVGLGVQQLDGSRNAVIGEQFGGTSVDFTQTLPTGFSAAGPFHDFYTALLTKGMNPSMARLTLARKIAAITLLVWKKGVCFDAQQLKRQVSV